MARAFEVFPKSKILGGILLKKKVFVCVGTHTQQFDRLLKAADKLAEKTKNNFEFFAQTGHSNFQPKNMKSKKFLDEKEFYEKIDESDLIIGHGGAGLIISGLSKKKKIIIMPRLKEFGEHTNSHQVDIARHLAENKKVLAVFDKKKLEETFDAVQYFEPVIESGTKKIVMELEEECSL